MLLIHPTSAQIPPSKNLSIEVLKKKIDKKGAVKYFYKRKKFTGQTYDYFKLGKKVYSTIIKDGLPLNEYAWDENHRLVRHYEYRDGMLHGNVLLWFGDGQKYIHHLYRNGKMDGQQFGWYKNGQLRFDSFYKMGLKQYQVDYDQTGNEINTIHSLKKF